MHTPVEHLGLDFFISSAKDLFLFFFKPVGYGFEPLTRADYLPGWFALHVPFDDNLDTSSQAALLYAGS